MDREQRARFEELKDVVASRKGEYAAAVEAQRRVWEGGWAAGGEASPSGGYVGECKDQRARSDDRPRSPAAVCEGQPSGGYVGECKDQRARRGERPQSPAAVCEAAPAGALPLMLHSGLPGRFDACPRYNHGEAYYDKDKMLLNGMLDMAGAALGGMQAVPSLRADMGCGIIPSMFPGVVQRVFFDERAPWVVDHLSKERISSLDAGNLGDTDEFKRALEHMAHLAEGVDGTGGRVFPLDIQGPFDTAHLVYGDAIFYDLYDDPPFVRHLMELSCRAIELGFEKCLELIPGSAETVAHYNSLAIPRSLGGIKLSEDTSTLVCGDHLDEYVVPATARVLGRFGGGYIHYCGRNDGLFERVLKLPLARGLNFGNPEFHDMEDILRRTSQSGKVYTGAVAAAAMAGSASEGAGLNVAMAGSASEGAGSALAGAGVSRKAHFERLIRAATDSGGRCRLLLQASAPYGECSAVAEDWSAACELCLRAK